jgi:anti-anti-sigma factor
VAWQLDDMTSVDGPSVAAVPFRVDVVVPDGEAVLVLTGELDPTTAPRLLAAGREVMARGKADLVADLSGVTLLSAAGVGALVELRREAEHAGGGLAVRGAAGLCREVLDLAAVDELVNS